MKPRVLVDCGYSGEGWEEDRDRLARHVELVEPEGKDPYSEEGLIAALQGCQGLIRLGGRIPALTRAVFAGAPELRIAGLDVFDPEPLPKDSPLRGQPNAFLSPHIAWCAPHAYRRYFSYTALEFERFFSGQPLQYELTRRMVDIRNGRI